MSLCGGVPSSVSPALVWGHQSEAGAMTASLTVVVVFPCCGVVSPLGGIVWCGSVSLWWCGVTGARLLHCHTTVLPAPQPGGLAALIPTPDVVHHHITQGVSQQDSMGNRANRRTTRQISTRRLYPASKETKLKEPRHVDRLVSTSSIEMCT